MLSYGIFLSFGVFFEPILSEFGLEKATTSAIVSLCMLIQGFLGVVMGRLTDKLGPRIVLTFCGLLIGIGYLLMSQVSSIWQLYLVNGLILGVGLSGVMVPLMSTLARWFDKKRSMMAGIMLNGVGIGRLIMPPAISLIIEQYGWRMAYLIMGSITLVIIVLAAQFLRRDPSSIKQSDNNANNNYEHILKSGADGYNLKEAFYTRQFWLVLALFFFLGFCRFTVSVHIVPHAIEMGISAIVAANILATIGGVSFVARPLLGIMADRIGNRNAFIIGFIILLIAYLLLVPARMEWILFLIVALIGINMGINSAEAPLVAGLFGLKAHGIIFGVVGLGYTIGASLGPFLAGYIYDIANSYLFAFLLCIAFSISGIIISLLLRPIQQNTQPVKIYDSSMNNSDH